MVAPLATGVESTRPAKFHSTTFILSVTSYACLAVLILVLFVQQHPWLTLIAMVLSGQLASGVTLLVLVPWFIVSAQQGTLGSQQEQERVGQNHSLLASMLTRASNICSTVTGFGLVFVGWQMNANHLNSKDRDFNASMDIWMLLIGLGMLITSALALMLSFWPEASEEETNGAAAFTAIPSNYHEPTLEATSEYDLLRDEENFEQSTGLEGCANANACVNVDVAIETCDDDDQNSPTTPLLSPPNSPDMHNEAADVSDRLRGTRRLLKLAEPQTMYLYLGCFVLLLRLPCSLSMPHFVATTLSALAQADFHKAHQEILYLLVAGSIDALLDFWCVFLFGYSNQRIVKDLRLHLFGHLLRQEMGFFDVTSTGELTSRLTSDCSEMGGDLTWFFRFSIESVVRITGITTYMLWRCPTLGACAVSMAPIVAAINRFYGVWLAKNAEQVQNALAEANNVAQQALTNVRTVIAFAAERQESKRYSEKIEQHFRLNVRQLYMTGVYYMAVSTFLINTVVQGMLLYVGSHLIERHGLSSEVLLAFMLYQGSLQQELLNLFQSYSSLIKSSGAGDKVFALLDRRPPPPATNSEDVIAVDDEFVESDGFINRFQPATRPFSVHLKNVSFSYPSRPQAMVLSSINLDIPRGKTLALVGSSGCGKSSIINLIQRMYDPERGTILIDGWDLCSFDILAYRREIGVVTQEPVLFQGSILDNILYGCPQTSREEAIRAAVLANADSFIQRFPAGYETQVGERGGSLSGGQRQRIAIARAIVKKPSLLILDEATSCLDSTSEKIVQEALDKLLLTTNHSVTTIVIAHRLQTVRNADYIAVIDQGQVAELGSHSELMNKANGSYKSMVERAGTSNIFPEN